MRGGRVQGAGSGRSPAACGGESRLRLLCSGFAGTGCAPARPRRGGVTMGAPCVLWGVGGGGPPPRPPPPQIRKEKEILVKRAKKEYNENSI